MRQVRQNGDRSPVRVVTRMWTTGAGQADAIGPRRRSGAPVLPEDLFPMQDRLHRLSNADLMDSDAPADGGHDDAELVHEAGELFGIQR